LLYSLSCAHGLIGRALGFWFFAAAVGCWLYLKVSDLRARDVRLLLGRHRLGSSDPATWTAELRSLLAPAPSWFGTSTFALAVEPLLQQSRFCEAMWAARLAVLEDPRQGADLTERVLRDPRVAELLSALRRDPASSASLLRREHPRPFPLVQKAEGPIAEFWYGKLFDNAAETLTQTTYAAHLAGQLAMAFEPDEDDESPSDAESAVAPAAAAENRQYALGGLSIVGGSIAACLSLIFLAELTRLRLPAFGQPAIARPAPPPQAQPQPVAGNGQQAPAPTSRRLP
jgi:hypothetical protein